jgi:hypothetical protein
MGCLEKKRPAKLPLMIEFSFEMHPVDFVNICKFLATVPKLNLSEILIEIFYILQEVR